MTRRTLEDLIVLECDSPSCPEEMLDLAPGAHCGFSKDLFEEWNVT